MSRAFRPGDQDHGLEKGTPALGGHASPGVGAPGPVRRAPPEEQRGRLLSWGALVGAPVDEPLAQQCSKEHVLQSLNFSQGWRDWRDHHPSIIHGDPDYISL